MGWIFYEMWFKVTDMIERGGRLDARVWSALVDITRRLCSGDLQRTERGTRTQGKRDGRLGGHGAALGGARVQLTKLGSDDASTPGKSVAVGQTPMKTEAFGLDEEEEDLEAKLQWAQSRADASSRTSRSPNTARARDGDVMRHSRSSDRGLRVSIAMLPVAPLLER